MASFLSLSQHIRLCEPAAAVLVIVSGDVVVLYHSDPVGQNMVYSQVCRLSESTTLVLLADMISDDEPMTYAFYREIKGGKSPKAAPTYFKDESKKEVAGMQKYKCTVCGYIYDPEQGDPDSGIKPGTPFENLPDTWVCPVCGADKSLFEKEG